MDATTQAVRAMYERFPYPTGEPNLRTGGTARLVLTYGRLARAQGRPLRVLDAGCGRGLGVIGQASTQPDVEFTAIDVNRVGLAEARQMARQRGLDHVRFAEVDLMTLEGLSPPPGGYDVIHASGVVHHLADPEAGLANLASVLSPHGVMVLMLYARPAREPLFRVARAIDRLVGRDVPPEERLALGRAVAGLRTDRADVGMWRDTAPLTDVEFVDRYLNVNETSYDIEGLWSLLAGAELRFLRWCTPSLWSVEAQLPPGPVRDRALALPDKERFQLIEQLCWREQLELIACRRQNGPRPPIARAQLAGTIMQVNPEITIAIEKRNLRGSQRIERVLVREQSAEPEPVARGPLATALLTLADQNLPFDGRSLASTLMADGCSEGEALDAIEELLRREWVFAPHAADV